ncbi:S53 family peptidase [Amycolatopsis sp.]|uniref:S53 family peptidase n=1 Tax=Amycolatopsis sp. TaxID=37632 RepID=UPI002B525537|nr:S53 family peptidase [Amycolatopsis sp.]HVV14490.1 S53 family peptidase [Amycolatopsis sp.]
MALSVASRTGRHRPVGVAVAAAIALGVSIAQVPAASAASELRPVGSAPVVPHDAVRLASPDANQQVQLSVELSPRDPAALNAFVTAVSTPGSPQYHQYLPKGQFAATFGPAQSSIDTVTAALKAEGLNPDPVSADGLSIPVHTTLGEAAKALHVSFAGYRLHDGRTTFANTAPAELPSNAATAVTGIVGLNDFVDPEPHNTGAGKRLAAPANTQGSPVQPNVTTASYCSDIHNLLTSNGVTDTVDYWEPVSLAASSVYNTSPLYSQYGNNGAGVNVGVFELENYSTADVAAFEKCFGVKTSVSAVKVDGGPTLPADMNTGVGLESALDIEVLAGLAPGIGITVYQGPDNANSTQYLDTYRRMVTDDTVQVISTSWGVCEADLQDWDPSLRSAEANVFAAAAAQGQTVVAASGDSGSTGCYHYGYTGPYDSQLNADDPAAQPNVLAVGGTRMTSSSASQSTWNTQTGASGGGVSKYSQLSGSANYQSTVQGAGYSDACGAASGATCRQVPDVSAVADPNTGYLIANGQDGASQYWTIIGGTSGSAPLWAAILALTDASHSCAANGAVGLVNPALYQHASLLKDITSGSNALSASGYTGSLYAAGTGYDLATGLGTPNAANLVEPLCAAKPASVGSSFSPVAPGRILDTRSALGTSGTAPLGAGATLKLPVTGTSGVPSSGVTAVVLNVTATEPTDSGFLTLYPDGQPRPASSNLNFVAGQTIPNLVTVPVGANGTVDIYNRFGTVHVIADVFGYYSTGSGSLYQPLTPARVLDTRSAIGVPTKTPLGTGATMQLPVTGSNGVPSTGVTAVVLNVTATESTDGGFLTLYPDGQTRPASSNLNFVAGQTIPNLVIVPVGANGTVDIYNRFGTVHVIADVFGYFTSSGTGYKFHTSAPQRLLDTRSGQGVSSSNPVGTDSVLQLPLTDTSGSGNAGPLSTAAALVLNVTATESTDGGFLTVYPSGVARPSSSNLNFVQGQTIPNAVVTAVNGSAIDFYNRFGTVHVIADVFGYYSSN